MTKLEKAKEAYEKELEKVKFNMENAEGKIKVIKNIDGTIYKKTDNIRQILASHIINPVRFDKAIELMKSEGIGWFLSCQMMRGTSEKTIYAPKLAHWKADSQNVQPNDAQ